MPRNPSSTCGVSSREVVGTLLDRRKPPLLPSGLAPDVAAMAAQILEQNPHLWDDAQVDPVIRLAKIRKQMLELEREIEQEGNVITDHTGRTRANPLLQSLNSSQRMALSMERALSITFVAKGSQVKDHEAKRPGISSAVSELPRPGKVRPLRLA